MCRINPTVAYVVGGAKVIVDERDSEDALEVIRLAFPGDPPFKGSFTMVGIAGGGLLVAVFAVVVFVVRSVQARLNPQLEPDDETPLD